MTFEFQDYWYIVRQKNKGYNSLIFFIRNSVLFTSESFLLFRGIVCKPRIAENFIKEKQCAQLLVNILLIFPFFGPFNGAETIQCSV